MSDNNVAGSMAMKLVPKGRPCTLEKLPDGSLFAVGLDKGKNGATIALKSEYQTPKGAVEAFILGSGEMFWGDAENALAQRQIIVQPLSVVFE